MICRVCGLAMRWSERVELWVHDDPVLPAPWWQEGHKPGISLPVRAA